jgi:hypothetical protein
VENDFSGAELTELLASVRFLIERRPEALRQGDSLGKLAIHVAASKWAPIPLLQLLVERDREALQVRNAAGLLPIHLALHRERSPDMSLRFEHFPYVLARYATLEKDSVTLLLQEWPDAIRELDFNGRTGLHCAFDGPPTPGYHVALPLLKKWSGRVTCRTGAGSCPFTWPSPPMCRWTFCTRCSGCSREFCAGRRGAGNDHKRRPIRQRPTGPVPVLPRRLARSTRSSIRPRISRSRHRFAWTSCQKVTSPTCMLGNHRLDAKWGQWSGWSIVWLLTLPTLTASAKRMDRTKPITVCFPKSTRKIVQ